METDVFWQVKLIPHGMFLLEPLTDARHLHWQIFRILSIASSFS
jgi:hypothetical protein